ncbi:MAG: DoxX family protein [Akkermansiaceae bacterium]
MKKWIFSNSTMDPMASAGLLSLRLGIGIMMVSLHGWQKYQGFSTLKESFPIPQISLLSSWMNHTTSLACTIFAEVICAVLLVIGMATRPAAAVLAFTMGIAAFVILASKDAAGKELALLYLTGAVALFFTGAGSYSFDARFSIGKKRMFR